MGGPDPVYIVEKQHLRKMAEICFPIEEPPTVEQFMADIESNIDYYYRVYCKDQVDMDIDDPVYDVWVPLQAIFSYRCKTFEQIKDQNIVLNVLQRSNLFELNKDCTEIRGTEEYVKMNDPTANEDDDEYFY